MMTPTIRVGRTTLWLAPTALRDGELHLEHDSLSEQCDNCGRDILETGKVQEIFCGMEVVCDCGEDYPVVLKDVR